MRHMHTITDQSIADARAAREWCASGVARIVREGAGLSRGDVARVLDVSVSCVRDWENGDRRPRVAAAARYYTLLRGLMIPPGAAGSLR